MSSPLSPILADMVLDDLETSCIGNLGFDVRIFHRYVDDIFTILPTNKIQYGLDKFNAYHPRLKFTLELECNNCLNFLDVTVILEDDVLITNWYRKPTFSGRYINFFGNNPLHHKINVITSLIDRAILLSDKRFHDANIDLVKSILINNSYPLDSIERHIKMRRKKIVHRRNDNNNPDERLSINNNNNEHNKGFIAIPMLTATVQ
ncbi:uncharacterized protein LOC113561691 [Ooceraea biroi]|uniref:uncharacterized protein LOC113561689 n=1 Tax=Ooceraea biroi TaxID=2015173 RepID=UPI000F095F90|nr:uncharacterized protein LOC113561689 [Ooceraea biroi]XP_026824293.1 uncharacterized protein LOC113561691 [Ooceraea biroi]